jgi:rhodanese-related sulfurtransferase
MAYGTVPAVRIVDVPNPLPPELHVLDVREDAEWQHGHIEGARHIPLAELPSRIHELPDDGRLLVVCRVGARSAHAVAYLGANGRDAVNLHGGMVDWVESGRPMVSDTGHNPHVV